MSQNNRRLLFAERLEKSYGNQTIFSIEKLELYENDHIGLVGANGAGKSTLLAVLAGELKPDAGTVTCSCTPALIRQTGEPEGSADWKTLSTMGLFHSACQSGGEKTRRSIAAALSQNAPLLFADEPTTNLDLDGIQILREKFRAYPGALVLVSHDRALLDSLCTTIWEVEHGVLRIFPGTYSDWLDQKARERDFAEFQYAQYQREKRRLEQSIHQVREESRTALRPPRRMGSSEWQLYKNVATTQQRHVQSQAKSLERRLEQMEVKERPDSPPEISMELGNAHPIRSKTALRLENLTADYPSHPVLNRAACSLPTGKTTVLLGPNGSGKTTLIRAILMQWNRIHDADEFRLKKVPFGFGQQATLQLDAALSIQFASDLKIGCFTQEHETLDPKKTVLENARARSEKPEHEVRIILANLSFRGDDVHKKVESLSGGERAKTALAQLLASDANLLILDEPTNHIDLYTAEALEHLLNKWAGTLLVITHDQRLAETIADRLLICRDGTITAFEGTWTEYQESLSKASIPKEDAERSLQESILAMRLAEISSRISAPRKGDSLQALQAQWEQLNDEYQILKKR